LRLEKRWERTRSSSGLSWSLLKPDDEWGLRQCDYRDRGDPAIKPTSAVAALSCGRALYMPTLVAARYNADMKAKYEAMTAAGKPPKVAITTIMRKLIILANTLLRANRSWNE